MNLQEYIVKAKDILSKALNEDAGSEGTQYKLKVKGDLPNIEVKEMKILNSKKEGENTIAKIEFAYPKDYGFALQAIKNAYKDVKIISLALIF